eukprot:g17303.t1
MLIFLLRLEVLDTSWAKLQQGWQKSSDLDEVISQHERYLAAVEEGAFLAKGSEAILSGVSALLSLVLEFCTLQEQACASCFEVAAVEEEESVEAVFQAVRDDGPAWLAGLWFLSCLVEALSRALSARSHSRRRKVDSNWLRHWKKTCCSL